MTLSENLLAKLSELNDNSATIMAIENDSWRLTLQTEGLDRLSCSLREVTMNRRGNAPAGLTVKTWAERIAASVSGLRENLKVLEVDATENVAILRSESPSKKGTAVSYYEIRLQGMVQATVQRFEADMKGTTRREQVAFPLTHEVLGKLIDDIVG
ncbi:hypothetical protein BH11PLA2_BH11PLA2_28620 [soil metagenome]